MAAKLRGRGWLTRLAEVFMENTARIEADAQHCAPRHAAAEPESWRSWRAITGAKLRFKSQKIASTSRRTSIGGGRDRSIRKKIIGHGMSIFGKSIYARDVRLGRLRVFPVLHQPAGQHSRRVLLHPQVKKSANFLAEIGGVAEPREFIALKRVSRSGQKKLPRRLSFGVIHKGLLESN